MNIKELSINGHKIQFINEAKRTRSGFKHTSTMFIDGAQWIVSEIHYINRTWEAYPFRTAMVRGPETKKAERIDVIRDQYKSAQGINAIRSRIQKKAVQDLIQADYYVNLYDAIITEL